MLTSPSITSGITRDSFRTGETKRADEDERELRTHDLSAGPDAPALERLEAAEAAATLREAVSNLPTKQRMTLELRIYEDLPFRDIANALEISEGAAKVNFHYAVKKLRKMLSP